MKKNIVAFILLCSTYNAGAETSLPLDGLEKYLTNENIRLQKEVKRMKSNRNLLRTSPYKYKNTGKQTREHEYYGLKNHMNCERNTANVCK